MYVRLAFAVSAFLEPEILILDEILAVGDIKFRTKCFKRLEQLINGGIPFFLWRMIQACNKILRQGYLAGKGSSKLSGRRKPWPKDTSCAATI